MIGGDDQLAISQRVIVEYYHGHRKPCLSLQENNDVETAEALLGRLLADLDQRGASGPDASVHEVPSNSLLLDQGLAERLAEGMR